MPDLVLHHYLGSPYAEKIRCILGFKDLAWRSVEISPVMPRPLLMPLTGGYRRSPVLQVGADVYCDTRRIAARAWRRSRRSRRSFRRAAVRSATSSRGGSSRASSSRPGRCASAGRRTSVGSVRSRSRHSSPTARRSCVPRST